MMEYFLSIDWRTNHFHQSTLCRWLIHIQILQISEISQWWWNTARKLIGGQITCINHHYEDNQNTYRSCRLVRFPSDDGIVPVNWLENNSLSSINFMKMINTHTDSRVDWDFPMMMEYCLSIDWRANYFHQSTSRRWPIHIQILQITKISQWWWNTARQLIGGQITFINQLHKDG